jgi:hypothetical protein
MFQDFFDSACVGGRGKQHSDNDSQAAAAAGKVSNFSQRVFLHRIFAIKC